MLKGRPGFHFENWAKTYGCDPELYFEPTNESEVRQVLHLAKLNKKSVKVIGNHHSPSDIACTRDYMVSLKHLNQVLEVNVDEKTVKVEAGILLSRLNKVLDENGLALSVLGSISGISLAGAISTGTHGTGKNFTILSGYIVEMELLTSDGQQRTLSREKDVDIFLAAALSLGSLGIITKVTLQCEPAFRLQEVKYGMKLQQMLENLDVHRSSSDHFRAMWYPHTDDCLVFHLSRTTKSVLRNSSWFWDYFIGYVLLQFLYWISSFIPSIVPWINWVYYKYVHSARTEAVDKSHHLFNFDCLFQQYVMEFAIPVEQTALVLYKLKAWIDNNFCAHLPVEIRFVKGDDFYLSPSYNMDTCYINIIMYRPYNKKIPFEKYWAAYQDIMLKAGGRPHWAKDHTISTDQLRKAYPCWNRFMEIRQQLDPDGIFLNDNLRKVFGIGNSPNKSNGDAKEH